MYKIFYVKDMYELADRMKHYRTSVYDNYMFTVCAGFNSKGWYYKVKINH